MKLDDTQIEEMEADASGTTRSPVRTVQVLHELALTSQGMTLAALSTALQLPKTSLFRLLRSLEIGRYVQSADGHYQIGPAARELGSTIMRNHDFTGRARHSLQTLASRSGETVILGTRSPNGTDVVYSSVIEGINPLRFSIGVGTVKPLQCSASGQTILAYMAKPAFETFRANAKFPRYASGSITSVRQLESALDKIRRDGIAVSVNGIFEGVYSIAAPVVDASGSVCAGVSISAPAAQAGPHTERFETLVRETGQEISRALGYTGHYPPKYMS